MAYDWRGAPMWRNLDDDQKWAAMSLMEAGYSPKKTKQAQNVAHAIYNRANLLGDEVGSHIETKKGKRYGWYQPLYEANQYKRLPNILKSQQFKDTLDYVRQIRSGKVEDPTGGATRYLVPAKQMLRLSGGVRQTRKGLRGNSSKYYSWPEWTGYDPSTRDYKGKTVDDGVHSFLIPEEDQRIAKKRGVELGRPIPRQQVASAKPSFGKGSQDLWGVRGPKPEETGSAQNIKYLGLANKTFDESLKMGLNSGRPEATATPTPTSTPEEEAPVDLTAAPFKPQKEVVPVTLDGAVSTVKEDERPVAERLFNVNDNATFDPFVPKNLEEALEEQRKRFNPDEKEVSWSDAIYGMGQTNWTLNNIQHYGGMITDPARNAEQEGFRVTKEDLKDFNEDQWEYLLDANNSYDLEIKKIEAKSRQEGQEQWQNMSWAQYLTLGAADLSVDLVPAIAFSIAASPIGTAAAVASKIPASTRWYRAVQFGTEGAIGAGAEMALTYGSSQITGKEALAYTAMGGVLGAGIGSYFMPKQNRLAMIEAAEDTMDKATPRPVNGKPIDQKAEIETTGFPARDKLSDQSSVVYRANNDRAAREAVEKFDEDVSNLVDVFDSGKLTKRGTNKLSDDVINSFRRQSVRNQEPETVYVAVPNRSGDISSALNDGIALGRLSLRDAVVAARATKQGHKVYEVQIAPGSKVLRDKDFGLSNTPTTTLFGDGKLAALNKSVRTKVDKITTKTGKDVEVEVISAKFTPRDANKGVKQFATAYSAQTGKRLRSDELAAVNTDLILNGWDNAAATTRGASAGAHRVAPEEWRLGDHSGQHKEIMRAFKERPGDAPEEEALLGFTGIGRSISRAAKLAASANPVIRSAVPYLMDGMLDLTKKQLRTGAVRPKSADQVRRQIVYTSEKHLMNSHTKNYKAYKKAKREAGDRTWGFVLQEQFETEVTAYMRKLQSGLAPGDVSPAVKAHAAFLKDFYANLLDLMADPGKAVGMPGAYKPIAGMDAVKEAAKGNFVPRSWSSPAIAQVEALYGGNALRDYLEGNLKYTLAGADLKPSLIRKMAVGMSSTIQKSKGGWNTWTDAAFGKADAGQLYAMMKASRAETGITDAELESLKEFFFSKLSGRKETAGGTTHHRVYLSESLPVELRSPDGRMSQKVTLADFTNTNATTLARDYLYKTSGRIALGSLEIPGPDGKLLVKGFSSDQDWRDFMDLAGRAAVELTDNKSASARVLSDEGILENYYQMMTHTYPSQTWQWVQGLKMVGSIRYLGMAGFPQLGENINAVAHAGAHALMRLPDFASLTKAVYQAARRQEIDVNIPLMRLIEDDMGLGTDLARLPGSARYDNLSATFAAPSGKQMLGKGLMHTLEGAQNHVLTYSGLIPLTSWGHKATMAALHDQMAAWATKYTTKNLPRRFKDILKNAGLNASEIDAAMKMYADDTVVRRNGSKYFSKVEMIEKGAANFDAETYWKVQHAFGRMATQAIQENKWGMMPPGWDNPIIKVFGQIRSFMVGSVTGQLVNNTRKMGSLVAQGTRDFQARNFSWEDGMMDSAAELSRVGASTFGQMMSGATAYVALQGALMVGMNDDEAEEHWEKIFTAENLALAAISRSGWLGSIPFLYDNTVGAVTGSKFSGFRSSGMTEDLFGNPQTSLIKDIGRGLGSAFDDDKDAQDIENMQRMFTNLWYVQMATDYFSRNVLKLDAPKQRNTKTKSALSPLFSNDD